MFFKIGEKSGNFIFESGTLECEGTLQTVDILYLFGTENIFVILSIRMRLLGSGLMKVVGNSLYIHCERVYR